MECTWPANSGHEKQLVCIQEESSYLAGTHLVDLRANKKELNLIGDGGASYGMENDRKRAEHIGVSAKLAQF